MEAEYDTVGDYIIEAHLGSGSFARVFLGFAKAEANKPENERTRYAIKTILLESEQQKELINKTIWAEYNAAQKLQHPSLVRYCNFAGDAQLSVCENGQRTVLPCAMFCMELVTRGDFFNLIMNSDFMDEAVCKHFFV